MIKQAAIKEYLTGIVWVGHRHSDIYMLIIEQYGINYLKDKNIINGFITDEGEFVDRIEAFSIAISCEQIEDPKDNDIHSLISEDLY